MSLAREAEDVKPAVRDPLEEVNLESEKEPRITWVNGLLDPTFKDGLITLLREYKDCFAWEYHKMPGLDQTLVEHRLSIKEGARPIRQAPRRMTGEIMALVQQEIHKLLKAGFIRTSRCVEWISNIVSVKKKNGKY